RLTRSRSKTSSRSANLNCPSTSYKSSASRRFCKCWITSSGNDSPKSLLARRDPSVDRKSTRLNSSHVEISYAVFCLKKKKKTPHQKTLEGPQHGQQNGHNQPT